MATTDSKKTPRVFTYLADDTFDAVREGPENFTSRNLPASEALLGTIMEITSGGETQMHRHVTEDHYFFLLEGEATFHLGSDEDVVILKKHDGIIIPRNQYYLFFNSGDRSLVLLRVGSGGADRRFLQSGEELANSNRRDLRAVRPWELSATSSS